VERSKSARATATRPCAPANKPSTVIPSATCPPWLLGNRRMNINHQVSRVRPEMTRTSTDSYREKPRDASAPSSEQICEICGFILPLINHPSAAALAKEDQLALPAARNPHH
jgi:hypothetical protein